VNSICTKHVEGERKGGDGGQSFILELFLLGMLEIGIVELCQYLKMRPLLKLRWDVYVFVVLRDYGVLLSWNCIA